MKPKHLVDPELLPTLELIESGTGGELDLSDIGAARETSRSFAEIRKARIGEINGVNTQVFKISTPDNSRLGMLFCRPDGIKDPLPALLWMHGGGFIMGSAEQEDLVPKHLARELGCVVISVDYRLAPEHPFPTPLEDCYTALSWLWTESGNMGVVQSRIAVGGTSAGAGLAAGLSLLARDRAEIDICYQLLLYPALDDRNVAPPDDSHPDTHIWSRRNNRIAWKSYLRHEPGGSDVSFYAAPSRAKDLSGLPPAYITVGALDLFLSENVDYARRLLAAGVSTELHVFPGAYHGFNFYVPEATLSKRLNKEMAAVLKHRLFN